MLFVFIIIGLGVQETLLSFSGVIVLVIFLAIIYRIVRIGRTSVDLELEKKRLRSFADLPDSYHVFQGAYVEFEGRSYSCDYFVISPSCCFAIMEERSPGRFEGNTDFDIWTIINEEKGREVKKRSVLCNLHITSANILCSRNVEIRSDGDVGARNCLFFQQTCLC